MFESESVCEVKSQKSCCDPPAFLPDCFIAARKLLVFLFYLSFSIPSVYWFHILCKQNMTPVSAGQNVKPHLRLERLNVCCLPSSSSVAEDRRSTLYNVNSLVKCNTSIGAIRLKLFLLPIRHFERERERIERRERLALFLIGGGLHARF